jgi:hypothetical protein
MFLTTFLAVRIKPVLGRAEEKIQKKNREKVFAQWLRETGPGSPLTRKRLPTTLRLKIGTSTSTTIIIPATDPENEPADEAYLRRRHSLRRRLGARARRKPDSPSLETSQDTAFRVAQRAVRERDRRERLRAINGMSTMRKRVA